MLLAVDSSTQTVGLALFDGTQVMGEMIWQTHNHHTVELAPALESLFRRCNVSMSALQALGVSLGPGSFTSLRIGLALVKGFALALMKLGFYLMNEDVTAPTAFQRGPCVPIPFNQILAPLQKDHVVAPGQFGHHWWPFYQLQFGHGPRGQIARASSSRG